MKGIQCVHCSRSLQASNLVRESASITSSLSISGAEGDGVATAWYGGAIVTFDGGGGGDGSSEKAGGGAEKAGGGAEGAGGTGSLPSSTFTERSLPETAASYVGGRLGSRGRPSGAGLSTTVRVTIRVGCPGWLTAYDVCWAMPPGPHTLCTRTTLALEKRRQREERREGGRINNCYNYYIFLLQNLIIWCDCTS